MIFLNDSIPRNDDGAENVTFLQCVKLKSHFLVQKVKVGQNYTLWIRFTTNDTIIMPIISCFAETGFSFFIKWPLCQSTLELQSVNWAAYWAA